jgi:hypothetical protein
MSKQDISIKCDSCGGIGLHNGPNPENGNDIETTCTKCNGMGFLLFAQLNQDLVDNIESTKDKVDWLKKNVKEILKKLDIEEV